MKQELIAGIILCVIGLSMLLLPLKTRWKITEKWKRKEAEQPSDNYAIIMRVLGLVFAAVGVGLPIWG